VFFTTHEGWVLKIEKGGDKPERWVDVGGRPLGLAFDSADNMWVANAYIGLQKVTADKEITVEATQAESIPILYADDLVVTPNGKVYFSDASTKFPAGMGGGTLSASLLDLMEHGLHGRIIEFDPKTKETKVIMRDLSFANGVTSDKSGSFLLVAETGSYRVWKYLLRGSKAGQSEPLIENLPGFPDNIHRGLKGRYWLGLTSPRSKILDDLAEKPIYRKIVQRLPSFMRPAVEPYGHIIAIDKSGRVLDSLQDPAGAYPATTGAWETKDYLYVSSLTAPILARFDKPEILSK
jgi:sugar lactone lactonase YvrE